MALGTGLLDCRRSLYPSAASSTALQTLCLLGMQSTPGSFAATPSAEVEGGQDGFVQGSVVLMQVQRALPAFAALCRASTVGQLRTKSSTTVKTKQAGNCGKHCSARCAGLWQAGQPGSRARHTVLQVGWQCGCAQRRQPSVLLPATYALLLPVFGVLRGPGSMPAAPFVVGLACL